MSTAYASIDLTTLQSNARHVREKAGRARLMAVVKANAYGHGAVQVVKALREIGVEFFAVATVEEAIALREVGIGERILVMSSMMPTSLPEYSRYGIDATIGSSVALEAVLEQVVSERIRVHLKIDTGMGRIGLQPAYVGDAMRKLRGAANIELAGVSTHLATADEDDLAGVYRQIERFNSAISGEDLESMVVHIANTEGLARVPSAYKPFDNAMVRIGIGLYGCPVRADSRQSLGVRPIMTLSSKITNIKRVEAGTAISYGAHWIANTETTIATVGIGYADGYPRSLRGRSTAGVDGRRCPVVGTICMDMIMVDLGMEPGGIAVGDTVTLFGDGGPDVSEVAGWANTITYEITSGIGTRVERLYT